MIGLSFDDVAKAAMTLNPSAFREKESARSINKMKYSAYKERNGGSDFPNGRLLLTAESAHQRRMAKTMPLRCCDSQHLQSCQR